ncbi:mulatexin-like isoform X2 [Oryza brachyantha]|uniref:mulatexin-like isoform X2 n=1 Tax=Oryza brachyantha TaxID=4533 RepID=UPI001ADC84DD|nr:mulatexin-like isoform X2 [Oryza brachyantha]
MNESAHPSLLQPAADEGHGDEAILCIVEDPCSKMNRSKREVAPPLPPTMTPPLPTMLPLTTTPPPPTTTTTLPPPPNGFVAGPGSAMALPPGAQSGVSVGYSVRLSYAAQEVNILFNFW